MPLVKCLLWILVSLWGVFAELPINMDYLVRSLVALHVYCASKIDDCLMIGRFWVSFLLLTPVRNKILKKTFWSFEVTAIFGTSLFFVIVNRMTTFCLYIWVVPNLCFLLSFFLYARFYEHMVSLSC